jgi:hypothetical protein
MVYIHIYIFPNSLHTFYHSFLSHCKFISNEDANVRNVSNSNANKETLYFLVFVLLFWSFVSSFRPCLIFFLLLLVFIYLFNYI